MASTNDSFMDEVAEALRRDRINRWFRRWGWLIALGVLAIVGIASFVEWRQSRAEADAEFRGEALLTAIEIEDQSERAAALAELPREGAENVVAAFLVAAEQLRVEDPGSAVETLRAVTDDGNVPPVWRDLATLKVLMIQGPEADPAALAALAQPGAPFRFLAEEQLALVHLEAGRTEEAIAALRSIRESGEASASQQNRAEALLIALGAPPEAAEEGE